MAEQKVGPPARATDIRRAWPWMTRSATRRPVRWLQRTSCAGDEASAESKWLQQAGLEGLSQIAQEGAPISEAALKEETVGFTPQQVDAIRQRVNTLNE